MPGWALNVTVDELLKKEFDLYRKEQKPHPIMVKHKPQLYSLSAQRFRYMEKFFKRWHFIFG